MPRGGQFGFLDESIVPGANHEADRGQRRLGFFPGSELRVQRCDRRYAPTAFIEERVILVVEYLAENDGRIRQRNGRSGCSQTNRDDRIIR